MSVESTGATSESKICWENGKIPSTTSQLVSGKGGDLLKQIPVVGAVIFKEGKILAAQRKLDSSLGGLWEFPGGKIEKNESPREALMREIQEELEANIEVEEEICTVYHKYDFGIVRLTTFKCELLSENITLNDHEEIRWLTKQELRSVNWAPADIPTIDKIEVME